MATHGSGTGKARKAAFPRRGEIYWVNFDPTVGAEIRKIRPALVIQNDIGNRYSPITIVAAISSKFEAAARYPTEVVMDPAGSGLPEPSAVVLNQIRSVDRERVIRRIGKASPEIMERVNRAIGISLGLVGDMKPFMPAGRR